MEIKEVVSYSVLSSSNILEVSFRTIDDSEDEIRSIQIEYDEVSEYGYVLEAENFDLFFDEDFGEEIEDDFDQPELDQDELISFLNEYFMVNPEKLPESTIF